MERWIRHAPSHIRMLESLAPSHAKMSWAWAGVSTRLGAMLANIEQEKTKLQQASRILGSFIVISCLLSSDEADLQANAEVAKSYWTKSMMQPFNDMPQPMQKKLNDAIKGIKSQGGSKAPHVETEPKSPKKRAAPADSEAQKPRKLLKRKPQAW